MRARATTQEKLEVSPKVVVYGAFFERKTIMTQTVHVNGATQTQATLYDNRSLIEERNGAFLTTAIKKKELETQKANEGL